MGEGGREGAVTDKVDLVGTMVHTGTRVARDNRLDTTGCAAGTVTVGGRTEIPPGQRTYCLIVYLTLHTYSQRKYQKQNNKRDFFWHIFI